MIGDIDFDKNTRIWMGIAAIAIIGAFVLTSCFNDEYKDSGDKNVYLNEEACFADEVFVKVVSINVMKQESNEEVLDEEGDVLSSYTLNVGLSIEQRHTDWWINRVKIKPPCFKLKSVNLQAKSKMAVFIECLAKETLAIMISGAVEGSINIIEETINYVADYTTSSIENAQNSEVDFKPIKCAADSFEPFKPYKVKGPSSVNLSFPIKQEYLESENLIVLAIDSISHVEKRIFLTTRPATIDNI